MGEVLNSAKPETADKVRRNALRFCRFLSVLVTVVAGGTGGALVGGAVMGDMQLGWALLPTAIIAVPFLLFFYYVLRLLLLMAQGAVAPIDR